MGCGDSRSVDPLKCEIVDIGIAIHTVEQSDGHMFTRPSRCPTSSLPYRLVIRLRTIGGHVESTGYTPDCYINQSNAIVIVKSCSSYHVVASRRQSSPYLGQQP
ncbi:uncharacterized protein YALI1_B02850g [Yarrowia lipolytica]|uniref:Uncharacterized protein n=1 Tax=Yarrowia lipolytica TaxID=4952 RepID=A0A1D8N642_YARLL|nr:hypothetical protein YALI1_B02850g [Yarrowia lipolytica]